MFAAHLQIHPQLHTQHHANPAADTDRQNQSAVVPNPRAGETQSTNGLQLADHIADQANESRNNEALALTSPPLAPLDFSPPPATNGTHTVPPPHAQTSNPAPARIRTASEIASEANAVIWAKHHTSLYELKESVESLLATLWARDTDPRELEGMFEAMREEVKRTRERLVID
jgi:hypothetical protein